MPVPGRFLCGLGFAGNNAVRGRNLPDRKGPFELIEFVLKIPEHLFFLRPGRKLYLMPFSFISRICS